MKFSVVLNHSQPAVNGAHQQDRHYTWARGGPCRDIHNVEAVNQENQKNYPSYNCRLDSQRHPAHRSRFGLELCRDRICHRCMATVEEL